MSHKEDDVWKYLGAVFALGDVEEHDKWHWVRIFADYCGGQDAVDAVDVVMDLRVGGFRSKDNRKRQAEKERIKSLQTDHLLERLKSSAEAWIEETQPKRLYDVIETLVVSEDSISELRGRLFGHWSSLLENRKLICRQFTESRGEEAIAVALAERGFFFDVPAHFGEVIRFALDPDIPAHVQLQRSFGEFRVDFMILARGRSGALIVECESDLADEEKGAQAEANKYRDQLVQDKGWSLLRLSNSQIYRNPEACAEEVVEHLHRLPTFK